MREKTENKIITNLKLVMSCEECGLWFNNESNFYEIPEKGIVVGTIYCSRCRHKTWTMIE